MAEDPRVTLLLAREEISLLEGLQRVQAHQLCIVFVLQYLVVLGLDGRVCAVGPEVQEGRKKEESLLWRIRSIAWSVRQSVR